MRAEVIINIGLIGCGKTFYANKLATITPSFIVSGDAIRHMLFGKYVFKQEVESVVSKIIDSTIETIASEMILGIEPYNTLILDEAHLTRNDRISYIKLLKRIEADHNVENFFSIKYLYFIDTDGGGLERRMKENRNLSEDHWFDVYSWQSRIIQVPDNEELETYGITMTTINSFGAGL